MRGFLAALLVAATSIPAAAQDGDLVNVNGWSVYNSWNQCTLSTTFEGPGSTRFFLLTEPDEPSVLSISNSQWQSIEDKMPYPAVMFFDGKGVETKLIGLNEKDGAFEPGFTLYARSEDTDWLLDQLARSKNLSFYREGTLIDSLSLGGSSAAVAELRRCLSLTKRAIEANEAANREYDRRWKRLTGDPFAEGKED